MIKRSFAALACLGLLVACDSGGNPLISDSAATTTDTTTTTDSGSTSLPIDSNGNPVPGTASASANSGIFRSEPFDADAGTGFANSIAYDQSTDTFFVEGVDFDGDQPNGTRFSRSTPGTLSGFALYEAPVTVNDPVSGVAITQNDTRAIYGVSSSGDTEFAIVRTGAYVDYGFGGFVYQRNGDVVLPTEGQGVYTGKYGGIRDFDGKTGIELVQGDAEITIDFAGFRNNCTAANCDNAVRGQITNRRVIDTAGNDITNGFITAKGVGQMEDIRFALGPDVATENGEAFGTVYLEPDPTAGWRTAAGAAGLQTGQYYAVLSGDHTQSPGGEIVGVIVIEEDDPRGGATGVTVRETGGFIVAR